MKFGTHACSGWRDLHPAGRGRWWEPQHPGVQPDPLPVEALQRLPEGFPRHVSGQPQVLRGLLNLNLKFTWGEWGRSCQTQSNKNFHLKDAIFDNFCNIFLCIYIYCCSLVPLIRENIHILSNIESAISSNNHSQTRDWNSIWLVGELRWEWIHSKLEWIHSRLEGTNSMLKEDWNGIILAWNKYIPIS